MVIKRKTKKYGDRYDILANELENLLQDKQIVQIEEDKIAITQGEGSLKTLKTLKTLSDEELKKISFFVYMRNIIKKDSIVLLNVDNPHDLLENMNSQNPQNPQIIIVE